LFEVRSECEFSEAWEQPRELSMVP